MGKLIHVNAIILASILFALVMSVLVCIPFDVHAYTPYLMWSTPGTYSYLEDSALDSSGRLYVTDSLFHRVFVFRFVTTSSEGTSTCTPPERKISSEICLVTKWGGFGTQDGRFNNPTGIDIDSNGNIFVADMGNNRIQEFKLATPCPVNTLSVGNGVCFLTKWGSQGSLPIGGQFQGPRGLEVDPQDHVFVTEQGNNRIQEFQFGNPCPSGTTQVAVGVCFIKMWGTYGTGKGQFQAPQSIAFDSKGNVFVVEQNNNRVQIFRFQNPCQSGIQVAAGVCYFREWGGAGNQSGEFNNPFFITVDNHDDVLVGDGFNHRIQKFQIEQHCPSGMITITKYVCYVTEWGAPPTNSYPTLGSFSWISGISVDVDGRVYVTDGGWAIQVFKP